MCTLLVAYFCITKHHTMSALSYLLQNEGECIIITMSLYTLQTYCIFGRKIHLTEFRGKIIKMWTKKTLNSQCDWYLLACLFTWQYSCSGTASWPRGCGGRISSAWEGSWSCTHQDPCRQHMTAASLWRGSISVNVLLFYCSVEI